VCRVAFLLPLLGALACHSPTLSSGGAPKPGTPIPSRACAGDAPVDDALQGVPNVRASWFNPSASERLYVLEAGPELPRHPTLVLIHGVGAIGTGDFYPVLSELAQSRHVLAVDLPGFGRSDLKDKDFGPERLAEAVDRVVRACGTPRIDVLGHSSGGALALLFASTHPDIVRKLIVVDAAGILLPEVLLRGQLYQSLTDAREKAPVASKIADGLGRLMIQAMHALVPNASDLVKTGLVGDSPPVLAATRLLDYNFGRAILGVRAETLVLWGKNDHIAPVRIAHLLDDRVERSDLVFIEDAGHVPMKDQPALFASMVSGYLNEGYALVSDSGVPETPALNRTDAKAAARAEGPVHFASSGVPEQAKNVSTRVGRCDKQEDVILEGDYASIEVNACKHVWLNRVRAQTIHIKDSDGRLDSARVSAGVVMDHAEFSLTGGDLMGATALEVRESKLDLAGVQLLGDQRALRVDGKSELVFSVSPLESPHTARMLHETVARKEPFEM
jgi:pimeloyl-ACP methyl ester carboxylesterase